jgi:hypothetical protein
MPIAYRTVHGAHSVPDMPMNFVHRKLCSSEKWATAVAEEMPGQLTGFDLGENVLEIGPGFGATTL